VQTEEKKHGADIIEERDFGPRKRGGGKKRELAGKSSSCGKEGRECRPGREGGGIRRELKKKKKKDASFKKKKRKK